MPKLDKWAIVIEFFVEGVDVVVADGCTNGISATAARIHRKRNAGYKTPQNKNCESYQFI